MQFPEAILIKSTPQTAQGSATLLGARQTFPSSTDLLTNLVQASSADFGVFSAEKSAVAFRGNYGSQFAGAAVTINYGFEASIEFLLINQMQEIEARTRSELQRLNEKIDAISRAIEHPRGPAAIESPHVSSVNEEALTQASRDGTLADLLSNIANEVLEVPASFLTTARDALHSGDPKLRAAAARALCVILPRDAAEILPGLMETELNRFVRAVFEGAINAATK